MKKPLLWGLGILVALVAVVVAAGPWFYRQFIAGDADPELTLPLQTQAATTGIDGTRTVVPGPVDDANRTQVGYRADETLRGSPLTVNGRTSKVTGEAVVTGSKLESATFTVDVASITSPESGRDNQFRGEDIMDVAKFPTAEFKVTQPVDFSALPESGAPMTVAVPGTMTNKGVTRDATGKLDVKRAGERGDRRGSVPVTWTDYGVTPPDFAGFVKVRPTGTIEFLVNLTKK